LEEHLPPQERSHTISEETKKESTEFKVNKLTNDFTLFKKESKAEFKQDKDLREKQYQ
jgi:hypothetical protein